MIKHYIAFESSAKLLLKLSTLKKYDISKMYKTYDLWPNLAREAYNSGQEVVNFDKIDHIVFAGMGGSGTIGDILSSILSKTDIHVAVVKGYHLPQTVDSRTLVVTTSISGNTIETLSILRAARKLNSNLIAFSSGGMMQKFCNDEKIEKRTIPQVHSPRASFPVFLYSMLRVLEPVLPISNKDILTSLKDLEKTYKLVSSNYLNKKNPAVDLAEWISGIPIIYYPFGLQGAAVRFKNSLQENSKKHAIIEDVIEAGHNDIVAWERRDNVCPILLEGSDDYIKTKQRWHVLKKYFKLNYIDYKEVKSVNGNILSKLINLIYLLDYSTIYLAALSKIDPTPTKSIGFIKKFS